MRTKGTGPFLGVILCFLCFQMTATSPSYATETTLGNFWAKFGQPYQNAIHILANDALKPLADAPVPSRIEQADQLIQNTKTQFRTFYDILQPMRNEADQLKQQLDDSIINKTLQLSQLEQSLQNTTDAISAATTDLAQSNQALSDAQRELNEETARLESARSTLRSQEDSLQHATNCIWRSKRSIRNRRWGLSNAWRAVEQTANNVVHEVQRVPDVVVQEVQRIPDNVVNAVQEVVNLPCQIGPEIENARGAVRSAEDTVARNSERVTKKQASVSAAQTRIADLQRTKTQQEEQKRSLDSQIAEMRSKLQVLAEINTKMTTLVTYLGSMFDTNTTLQNAMKQMISIDALLEPLEHIAGLVGSFSGQDSVALQASVASIRQSMATLNSKLPQYPFDQRIVAASDELR